jgi:hypothetical protein
MTMPILIRPTLIALALAAGLAACGGRSEPPAPVEDAPAELRLVPTTSAPLAGFTYRLETYLWRDFAPGPETTAEGKPMIAVLKVTMHDATAAFPAGVTVDRMWVLNGDQVWRTVPREEQPRGSSGRVDTIEAVGRDGPRWGPGITVDVIVRLRDASGKTVLLRAAGQPIHRTS